MAIKTNGHVKTFVMDQKTKVMILPDILHKWNILGDQWYPVYLIQGASLQDEEGKTKHLKAYLLGQRSPVWGNRFVPSQM